MIYADDLIALYGVDAVRYYVLHEMPYENDGTITWELMTERFNSDLANVLGNLVNRTISMTNKYFGGIAAKTGVTEAVDEELKAVVTAARDKAADKMNAMKVAEAIDEVFAIFKRSNKYIDETEPWVLAKSEDKKDRLSEVMYNLLEAIAIGANLLLPYMPETGNAILEQISDRVREYETLNQFGLRTLDAKVTDAPKILFARQDLAVIMEKVAQIQVAQKAEYERENGIAAEPAKEEKEIDMEPKDEISYDDFAKLQFQVGEILACEAVPKSKKLLCSQVKIGSQVKQIVSGIKLHYSPEEMVGKKVMVLVNLAPRTIAGVESQGMLLCAEDAEGNLALMTPEREMPAGAEIC